MTTLLALLCFTACAVAQTGTAEGFASGVTGGGDAARVTPTTNSELVSYLTDSSPRVVVLTKTFDFTGSEGSVTETGCAPWGTGAGCQLAINNGGTWCGNEPKAQVTYDKAATIGIDVESDKTIVGVGSSGVLKGKGLRLVTGVSNVIIQNIHITELNPKYVFGGDALSIDGDMVWIDHVKVSRIGRQMVRTGTGGTKRITITNSDFDGATSYSSACDEYHYWGFLMQGTNDKVTFKGNYVHGTSGRSPKITGSNCLFHVLNNYFANNNGHAFDVSNGPAVVIEGNVFEGVKTPIQGTTTTTFVAAVANGDACSSALGRACQPNTLSSSGSLTGSSSTSFLSRYQGQSAARATQNTLVKRNVLANAGIGKI